MNPYIQNWKILNGSFRGFTINNDGEEITTHFFLEDGQLKLILLFIEQQILGSLVVG